MRIFAALAACALFAAPALAQVDTSQGMIEGLVPPAPGAARTRSLDAPAARQITVKGRTESVVAAVDLDVPFDFDSDVITEKARPILTKLGAALKDNKLSGFRFVVAGHTDAKGDDAYNSGLSERRAQAVLAHLTAELGIEASRLEFKGFGESELKDRNDPEGAVNRRVEVLNVGK